MRDIKFRAWHNTQKTMYYNDSVTIGIGGHVYFLEPSGEWEQDEEKFFIELMQCTGFKDKNGKEIYEGDIFGSPDQLRCVVEREADGAYKLRFTHPLMKGKKISILDDKVSKSPIIGNIYQNPELLK